MLVALLVIGHLAGLLSSLPGSVKAIGWGAQFQWISVLLAYWVDGNRGQRTGEGLANLFIHLRLHGKRKK
ncbi:MAG TPA: hypothetical protein VF939_17960 [Puia sp.]